jgi:hypothetical protein
MLDILAITFPIYPITTLGYLCPRHGLFAKADMRVLGKFVLTNSVLVTTALSFFAISALLRHAAS